MARASGHDPDATAALAAEIAASPKYRGLAPETLEDVVARELASARGSREARQRARKRLHEVAARYLGAPRPDVARRALEQAFASEAPGAVERACHELLSLHASTRERLPLIDELYRRIFARTGTPRVLADLACALGPLAYRFMGLPRDTRYLAYDIQREFVELLERYFELEGVPARVELRDVLVRPPREPADVALLLKMYHCLEKRRAGAGLELIAAARARHVVVSLPTRTIGGRRAPFVDAYFRDIRAAAARAGWSAEAADTLDGECFVIVHKPEIEVPA